MNITLKNLKYIREKEQIPITEAQALLLISDLITAAIANNGFTAEIEIQ